MEKSENHPVIPSFKIGVLLVNLGTPEGTQYFPMRKYLNEFLSDKRVIELPKLVWQPILNLFVLTFRPRKSGKMYEKIWDKKKNQSPLRVNTEEQAKKLKQKFNKSKVVLDWAMRYGNPSIESKILNLTKNGCMKILIVPLYPQYSATTTASVMDKVFDVMKKIRWQPSLRTLAPYYDEELYIEKIVSQIREHIKNLKWKPQAIICSFHGLPKKYFMKGDPYHCQCVKTNRLIKEKIEKEVKNVEFCIQSRFGPQEWLKPYMNEKFKELITRNVKKVCMIAPGFSSDCLETLEEIAIEGKEEFLEMGGTHFSYIRCLNDSDDSIELIQKLIQKNLKGWI